MAAVCAAAALWAAGDAIAPLGKYTAFERRYWAFQPRKPAAPPAISDPWIRNPVDAFILAGLRKADLRPAPEADRATLIRRVTYDLTGLPPTPDQTNAFLRDPAPDAYEKLIDRLLASPQYGEQWGRRWLDVVRFAESDGYEYDMHRPDAYRYRDYVVESFNRDKPYDQFVREQLAGDEMDPSNETYLVASGFNRLGPLRKNAGNQDVASSQNEVLTEMTNIVGAAFLGVTVGCARCHDHKFDPFRQSDYYRLQGHFAQTQPHDIVMASADAQAAWKAKADPIQQEIRRTQALLRKAPDGEKAALEKKLEDLDESLPAALPSIYSVQDDPAKTSPIRILFHGDYQNPVAKVGARPLGILIPETAPEQPLDTPKPRLRLAEWIVDPANPLTARVMVNRVWGYHFGRGIVSTPNDFGRMGSRPSNPELLDWLADRFVEGGWQLKPLHRLILLSAAYRQAGDSPIEKTAAEKDADNALVWKFGRRRLEAEELRDSMLALAGRLNPAIGGPSVLVPIDPELVLMLKRPQYWTTTRDKSQFDRRTLYMIYKRNLRLPFMEVFDAPDTLLSCARREQSTHAPQALELLNGQMSNELAAAFAARLLHDRATAAGRVDYAFRLAAGRPPTASERDLAMSFLAARPDDPARVKEFALSVFNLNAFLYVN